MMKSNAKATYEFQRWSRKVEKHLKRLLQNLPVWQGSDQYVDEQGLTEALAPYARLEGDLEQTLQRLQSWVLTAQRYCKRLLRIPDQYFAKYIFKVHLAPNWLEIEPLLEYYLPGMWDEEGNRLRPDSGQSPCYAFVIYLVTKVDMDQFCTYIPTEEGFEVEIALHEARLPYEVYDCAGWNSEVKNWLGTLLQELRVVRSTDFHIAWSGFKDNFSVVKGSLEDVLEAMEAWALSSARYAQEAVDEPELFYSRYIYQVGIGKYSLSLDIVAEHSVRDQIHLHDVAMCKIFRVSKHRFQIVAHTESVCQQWLEKMRYACSASPEELLAAGWILLDSSVGSYETPGHAGRTYYTSEEEPSPKPAKGDLKPQSPRRSE